MRQCEECGHIWNGLAQCTHPYRGHPDLDNDPGYNSDNDDDDDDDDEGDGNDVYYGSDHDDDDNPSIDSNSAYQNIVYDNITNEVMSQEMEVIHQLNDGCDLICERSHFSGEFCKHGLVMCDECGHIWDGNAQCTHSNL
jgi:hypothetical protein